MKCRGDVYFVRRVREARAGQGERADRPIRFGEVHPPRPSATDQHLLRLFSDRAYFARDQPVELLGHRLRSFILEILGKLVHSIKYGGILHLEIVHVKP